MIIWWWRQSYPLQGHAPHTVLPAPIRAIGAQTKAAVMETVAWRRARQRRGWLHLHGWDVEQSVAETCPVISGIHTQDAPRFAWRREKKKRRGSTFLIGKYLLIIKFIFCNTNTSSEPGYLCVWTGESTCIFQKLYTWGSQKPHS